MNLGRNLSEKLIRHSLLSELLSNLTLIVERGRRTIFPTHWYMKKVREEIKITPDNVFQSINIADDQINALGMSLIGRVVGAQLNTRCIKDALDRGVFIKFNPTTGAFQESPLHESLQQTLEDVQLLIRLDNSAGAESWDQKILTTIEAYRHGRIKSLEIPGNEMALAFAHYDRVENVFRGHLALCQVLLGLTNEIPSKRQPFTPLGEQEDRKMRSSWVSETEISQLIQHDIWPFGSKTPN